MENIQDQNLYDLQVKTLFSLPTSIGTECIKVLPLEPKRKLQKFAVGG